MQLGLFVEGYVPRDSTPAGRLNEMVEQAVFAEEVGLDSYGLSEQHFKFPTNSTPQPDLMLAAIGRETSRIRLGLEVMVLPLHHPLHVAERVAMLDVLSGGRVDFGVGRGNASATADAFGVSVKDSEARSLETLDIVLKAWEGKALSYDGDYYKFSPLTVTPLPVQDPRPPIYWAAISPGSHERGGALGYRLLTGSNAMDWSQLQRRIDRYRIGWDSNPGLSGQGIVRVNAHGFCAETDKEARDIYEPFVNEYIERTVKQYRKVVERTGATDVDFSASERFVDNFDLVLSESAVVIGDPDTCVSRLKRLAAMGVDEVTFRLDGPSHKQMLRCIELLGTVVKPALADNAKRGSGSESDTSV